MIVPWTSDSLDGAPQSPRHRSGLGLASAKALAAEGVHGRDLRPRRRPASRRPPPTSATGVSASSPTCRRRRRRRRVRCGGHRGPRHGRHPRHQRRRAAGGQLRQHARRCLSRGPRPQPDVGGRHGEGGRRPRCATDGWGRVVAITSLAVRQPMAELILSNTARAGATGFLKTVARELAGSGVTVNSVQPGLHRTAR